MQLWFLFFELFDLLVLPLQLLSQVSLFLFYQSLDTLYLLDILTIAIHYSRYILISSPDSPMRLSLGLVLAESVYLLLLLEYQVVLLLNLVSIVLYESVLVYTLLCFVVESLVQGLFLLVLERCLKSLIVFL